MPDHDDQQRLSRRTVLRGAAGAGAAGIAASTLAGAALPALAAARPAAPRRSGAPAGPADQVIVHVRDARSGEIDVFRGTSQTRLHDRDLAARLIRESR